MEAVTKVVTTELALPDPETATLARIPEMLRQAQLARVRCEETGDLATARELKRRLETVRAYISDKKARDELEGETRLTEVLIGKLLGPAHVGSNQHRKASHDVTPDDPVLGHVLSASNISRMDRLRFRRMAMHEDLVEKKVAEGVTKREHLLREIEKVEKPVPRPRRATTMRVLRLQKKSVATLTAPILFKEEDRPKRHERGSVVDVLMARTVWHDLGEPDKIEVTLARHD